MKKTFVLFVVLSVTTVITYLIIKPNPFKEAANMSFKNIKMLGELKTVGHEVDYLFHRDETNNFVFYHYVSLNKLSKEDGWVEIIPKKWICGSAFLLSTNEFNKEVEKY